MSPDNGKIFTNLLSLVRRPYATVRNESMCVSSASEGLWVYPKITSGSVYIAWCTSVLKQDMNSSMNYSSKKLIKKHNCCNLICIHILLVIYYVDYLCDFLPDTNFRLWPWCTCLYLSFITQLSTLILDSRDLRKHLIL